MRIVIIGAGGQAREVKWLISELSKNERNYSCVGFVVSDLSCVGEYDSRAEILGNYDWLVANRNEFDGLALGIGTPSVRLRVVRELAQLFPHMEWPTLIHPSVSLDESSCSLGKGCIIASGVRLTVNVILHDFVLLNQNVTLGHEANLGKGVVINPGANISGGVVIKSGVLIGTGAQVLQYRKVGSNSIVGAGAVVTKQVAENVTVVGVPAREVKGY